MLCFTKLYTYRITGLRFQCVWGGSLHQGPIVPQEHQRNAEEGNFLVFELTDKIDDGFWGIAFHETPDQLQILEASDIASCCFWKRSLIVDKTIHTKYSPANIIMIVILASFIFVFTKYC